MGPDHLVYVKGEGFLQAFTEEYRRYRYRDIQSFSVAGTSRIGLTVLYLLGVLFFGGILALTIGLRDDDPMGLAMIVFLSVLAAGLTLFLLLLLRHLILGPTCTCDIQTNLKKDRLRPLNRLHGTRQSLSELEGRISSAQEYLLSSSDGTASSDSVITKAAQPVMEERFTVPFPVLPTFGLFVLFAACSLIALFLESVLLCGISVLLLVFGAIALIGTLIACFRSATPDGIRTSLWSLLGLVFFFVGAASVYFIYAATNDPAYTIELTGPLEAFAGVATEGGMEFYVVFLALLAGIAIASLIGIIKTLRWKNRIKSTTHTPVEENS